MGKRVLIIDDDPDMRGILTSLLQRSGYQTHALGTATGLDGTLRDYRPDLVLCDLLMPDRDGLSVCAAMQADPETRHIPFVVVSAKGFEPDQRAALDAGACAYLVKPFGPEALLEVVRATLNQQAAVTVWGCRGSIAAPERALGRYGGNTPCVELLLPGGRRLIFDAGTGIRLLGNQLVGQSPLRLALFLTHYHWDHIQGLPFFKPLYVPGNEVHLFGPAESNALLTSKIQREMGGDYFPVSIESFRAAVRYVGLHEQGLEALGVSLSTLYTLHPGRTLAYRVSLPGGDFVYCPDNELLPESVFPELTGEAARLAQFARGAALLLHDAAYSRATYELRRGWGHSCGECLAAVAAEAGVERVMLFHHDPDSPDAEVEAIHAEFCAEVDRRGARTRSEPAREGARYLLGEGVGC